MIAPPANISRIEQKAGSSRVARAAINAARLHPNFALPALGDRPTLETLLASDSPNYISGLNI